MNQSPDYIADWGLEAEPIYVTDLDRCLPSDVLTARPSRGRWRTMPFETQDFSGTLIAAGTETEAADVTYPLDVQGWHAVSIGLHVPSGHEIHWAVSAGGHDHIPVGVKLTGDKAFTNLTIVPDGHLKRMNLEELYWKTADLTGQQVVFHQVSRRVAPGDAPGSVECSPARIAYIKLLPLSEAEVDALQADRRDSSHKRLFAHNDAFSTFMAFRPTTPEQVMSELEPYKDTDFSRVYWEFAHGDLNYYDGRVGRTIDTVDSPDYGRRGDRIRHESWRILREKGIDRFKVALDYAHEIGLEFHAAYRMAGWKYPTPLLEYDFFGGLYDRRPDLHCVDREGRDVSRLSFAFPEVQDFMLAMLRDVLRYDVDGVCLLYNRRPPYVDHEAPLIEGFKAKHGLDPRDLDERDPRWLEHRAEVVTGFMRRVREQMDRESAGRRKRLEVTACVLGKEEDNLYFGMDIAAWAREGLVDTVAPYSPAPLAMPVASDTWTEPGEVEPFVEAVRGTDCKLAINLMPRWMSPERYRRMADMVCEAGAGHLFFWDCEGPHGRANFQSLWNALRRLGHREEIRAWMEGGEPALGPNLVPLRTMDGWNMSTIAPG